MSLSLNKSHIWLNGTSPRVEAGYVEETLSAGVSAKIIIFERVSPADTMLNGCIGDGFLVM